MTFILRSVLENESNLAHIILSRKAGSTNHSKNKEKKNGDQDEQEQEPRWS
jgi:hypothetical protein